MMQYKGIYWYFFAPMIKKSIAKRFSYELARISIQNGKREYAELLKKADDTGNDNPMNINAYFAYVFIGVWLGSEKKISPEDMGNIMGDVLESLNCFFAITDINKHPQKSYKKMKKYEAWEKKNHGKYHTWNIEFDEALHEDGSYYVLTSCPICDLCKKLNISEIMPFLCALDTKMFEMQHGVLHRQHTIAGGDDVCDYWIVGDKITNPR